MLAKGKPVPTHRVVARGHAFPDHALAQGPSRPGADPGKPPARSSVEFAGDLLELAIDEELDTTDREQVDPGRGSAGLDLVADPEPPFPDAGPWRCADGIFDTPLASGEDRGVVIRAV